MSNLSVEGKIKRIHDEQVISDRFKKREFVIETEEQYPYKAANTKCQVTSESDTELLDQTNKTSSGGVQLSDFKDVERFSPE